VRSEIRSLIVFYQPVIARALPWKDFVKIRRPNTFNSGSASFAAMTVIKLAIVDC
jgi:hypothetical protein